MKISEVTIELIKPRDGLIGFASVIYEGNLYLGSIAIHQKLNNHGYRLTYPTKQSLAKDFHIFHPINQVTSIAIEKAILAKLNDVMKKVSENDRHHSPACA